MSDFTVIETQEQLDRIIGERIRRAEEKAAEKYSDYAELKTKNNDYANQISQLTEQIAKQTETINGHDAIVADLKAKVHQYETASVKTKVALELGLPYQMASRLTGEDEKEIRADAEAMAKLIGSQKPVAPLGSGEPVNSGDPSKAAWNSLVSSLTKEC